MNLDNQTESEILQGKDLISGYLDKGALKGAIKRLGEGEKMTAGAKAGAILDVGIGAVDAGQDIAKSIKEGKLEISGDNTFKKASNIAGIVAGGAEAIGLADPLLAPEAMVVGTGAELTSDVLSWFGDKENAKKQSSPARKQTQQIQQPQPKRIPSMLNSGMIHFHNNNVLQKVIS
jgi:hypothetical protein